MSCLHCSLDGQAEHSSEISAAADRESTRWSVSGVWAQQWDQTCPSDDLGRMDCFQLALPGSQARCSTSRDMTVTLQKHWPIKRSGFKMIFNFITLFISLGWLHCIGMECMLKFWNCSFNVRWSRSLLQFNDWLVNTAMHNECPRIHFVNKWGFCSFVNSRPRQKWPQQSHHLQCFAYTTKVGCALGLRQGLALWKIQCLTRRVIWLWMWTAKHFLVWSRSIGILCDDQLQWISHLNIIRTTWSSNSITECIIYSPNANNTPACCLAYIRHKKTLNEEHHKEHHCPGIGVVGEDGMVISGSR